MTQKLKIIEFKLRWPDKQNQITKEDRELYDISNKFYDKATGKVSGLWTSLSKSSDVPNSYFSTDKYLKQSAAQKIDDIWA